jgi:hypothetical protein
LQADDFRYCPRNESFTGPQPAQLIKAGFNSFIPSVRPETAFF